MKAYQGKTIDEVVKLLAKWENSKLIAGGTDLIINIRNSEPPEALIDISHIKELKRIEQKGDFVEIGAGVTFTQIVESELFEENLYGFKKACRSVGSPQIRNRGTIGGNIVNGSAAADSIPPLICLDSTIILESIRGIREVKLEEYFKHKQSLNIKNDELLTTIRFKRPKGILSFAKLGLRKALAISRISIASLVELDEVNRVKSVKIASGSIGKYPMREIEVEKYLIGKVLNQNTIDESVSVLQKSMDERLEGRPTLPYKRRAVEKVFKEALCEGIGNLSEVVS